MDISSNSEEAIALLEEAGWVYSNNTWTKDGKILSFSITVNTTYQDRVSAANVIANQLNNSGIIVTVNEVSNNTYSNYFNNKNYETIISGITVGYSPKISTLFSGSNLANYSSDTVNSLISQINSTTDYNSKSEIYSKFYDEYLNDFPYIFLYRETNLVVYNQTLCGNISPNAYSIFYNIDKWYRQ